jgi:hypothetical protein
MKILNPKIVDKIHEKTGLAISSIRSAITRKKQSSPSLTSNAVAYLYAQSYNVNVLTLLDTEDKAGISAIERKPVEKIVVKKNKKKTPSVNKKFLEYDTTDKFVKGHIEELNRAYEAKCYTSVFILARKIVENLIIDILKKKYPEKVKANKELYFDITKKRLKDFSVILQNLYDKRNDFGTENKAVEKLWQLAKNLKDNSNNKAHSWYHLVKKEKEVDDLDLKTVIDLIQKLERFVGIRN